MSRDGFREYTLDQVTVMATQTIKELDGLHGDPASRANWIRERNLAWLVLALVQRIKTASQSIEVKE
jgi:hypothetical protein